MITRSQIETFQRDGVVMLPGLLTDWVDEMRAGVARNMAEPGEYASENAVTEGRFFDDYCNWNRIPEFERLIRDSPMAGIAAKAMRSNTAQIFHDHVLVKEPGTPKPTPWHQDIPYYFVTGEQTVSFWLPLDPVAEASLRFIAGSHRWKKMIRPVSWADNADFYAKAQDWTPVPDPDANPDDSVILEWPMQPGDAVLFDFRTAHGARGNLQSTRRRALSIRWLGDDARFTERPGRTS
ncbi:MAG: phytanoyl-CoA dioxygenase, partial [Alphaproteobacteria bacterium]|nr:phytanoyl-CoA dioxygenase [Alphaproteobacteria bacterium]